MKFKISEIIDIIKKHKKVDFINTSGLYGIGSRYVFLKNGKNIRVSDHAPSPYDCHNRPCDLYIETVQYDEDCYPIGNTTHSDVKRLLSLI